jgi:hypothetical protein
MPARESKAETKHSAKVTLRATTRIDVDGELLDPGQTFELDAHDPRAAELVAAGAASYE